MYIYHFHASHQASGATVIDHFDGIMQCKKKIATMKDYAKVKSDIAAQMIGKPAGERITVESLSLLHR